MNMVLSIRSIIVLLGIFFAVASCSEHVNKTLSSKPVVDSFKTVISLKDANIKFLADNIPNVLLKDTNVYSTIRLLEPFGLKIKITSHRPIFNNEVFLCIPAAFTTPTIKIAGIFIENGILVNPSPDNALNGICIISKDSIQITSTARLNPEMTFLIQRNKFSLFQQALLVNNCQIVTCDLFGQKKNLRRALIQLNNCICVGES